MMTRHYSQCCVSLFIAISFGVQPLSAEELSPETVGNIRKLVNQLDSARPKERDEAEEQLLNMEENILPQLERLGDGLSFEIQERLQRIKKVLEERGTGGRGRGCLTW